MNSLLRNDEFITEEQSFYRECAVICGYTRKEQAIYGNYGSTKQSLLKTADQPPNNDLSFAYICSDNNLGIC
jgi:hypothetical protein